MPAWVVVGLGYGDEGKGTIVDALVRKTGASVVVRFNGGAQAAHNVVTPGGDHHCFSTWGAGTLAGARTILTKDVVLTPLAMLPEAQHLRLLTMDAPDPMEPFDLLAVDERCRVTTPAHAQLSQVREVYREVAEGGRHGSCGVGIGELMREPADLAITARDLRDTRVLAVKVRAGRHRAANAAMRMYEEALRPAAMTENVLRLLRSDLDDDVVHTMRRVGDRLKIWEWDSIAMQARQAADDGALVLEGAQGILLDEWHGFHPHTTWSTTTSENARAFCKDAGVGDVTVVGVTRAYATRHGAGPFPTYNGFAFAPGSEHNQTHPWQGRFRVGCFDAVTARYAVDADGAIDALAVTCLDHVAYGDMARICIGYENGTIAAKRDHAGDAARLEWQRRLGEFVAASRPIYDSVRDPVTMISQLLGKPTLVESRGPTATEKLWNVDLPVRTVG